MIEYFIYPCAAALFPVTGVCIEKMHFGTVHHDERSLYKLHIVNKIKCLYNQNKLEYYFWSILSPFVCDKIFALTFHSYNKEKFELFFSVQSKESQQPSWRL